MKSFFRRLKVSTKPKPMRPDEVQRLYSVEEMLEYIQNPDDYDPDIRASAVAVLAILADPRAIEPLLNLLTDKTHDWQVRRATALALGSLSDSRSITLLEATLQDEDTQVAENARIALKQLGVHSSAT